jgi:hypothetical protein
MQTRVTARFVVVSLVVCVVVPWLAACYSLSPVSPKIQLTA